MHPAYILLGYLFGSIPFGLILTRSAGLGDIRSTGSGSIGATNVLRTGRKGLAAATLLLDAAKGAAAVFVAFAWAGPDAALWAGAGAVLGHCFPVWLGFRGGKGVATGLGVLLAADWRVAVIGCVVWLLMAAVFRRSSLASLTAMAAAPIAAWGLGDWGVAWMSLGAGAVICFRHEGNIRRLLAGTEPRIGRGA